MIEFLVGIVVGAGMLIGAGMMTIKIREKIEFRKSNEEIIIVIKRSQ